MPILSAASAGSLLDSVALLLLVTAIGSVLTRRVESGIRLLALQGLLLAVAAATIALNTGNAHAYVAVALTLAVKSIAIPLLLLRALRQVRVTHEVELVIARPLALLVAIGLVFVAYWSAGPLLAPAAFATHDALPAALAMMLIGLFSMLIRKSALSQVVGLVALENGLYLAAVVATHGLPLAVELGVELDLLVAVLVMGLVVRQIHHHFDTIDTDQLSRLRG